MGLGKEVLRTQTQIQDSERTRNVFVPLSLIPSEPTNTPSIGESGLVSRLGEISRLLFAEGRKEQKAEEHSEKGKEKEKPLGDGFEPFVNPGPGNNKENLLVNAYAGNFAQQMSLNRKGIERVLEIAHLNGRIVLTRLVPSRQSTLEAQGNELAAKRLRSFGEKTDNNKEENPLSRIVSIPEGWRIEINDTRIMEELSGKERLSGRELQTAFIKKFNGLVKKGVWESVWKEKLTGEKDEYIIIKFTRSIIVPGVVLSLMQFASLNQAGKLLNLHDPTQYLYLGVGILAGYFLVNLSDQIRKPHSPDRKIDHFLEHFAPLIEIDKVVRSYAFLSMKGRRLVRDNEKNAK